MEKQPESYDVCIVCALGEEARAFLDTGEKYYHIQWTNGFNDRDKYTYRFATTPNEKGEPLTLHISWLPRYGPEEMLLHLSRVIEGYQPRLTVMTGICAGDIQHVKLGDLVVADRTFKYDSGKMVKDEQGRIVHEHDTITYQIRDDTLGFLRTFDDWKPSIKTLSRPASKRQQRDWLLCRLLKEPTGSIEAIPPVELENHAPAWRQLIQKLQQGPESFLSPELALLNKAKIGHLGYGLDPFPFQDPPVASHHISPLASGSAVRGDNPFKDIQIPVREAVAIDMEGAAFGRVMDMERFRSIKWLIVKGVSDYADQDKDDSYRDYAARASALYALSFIRAYFAQALQQPLSSRVLHKTRREVPRRVVITAITAIGAMVAIGSGIEFWAATHARFSSSNGSTPRPSVPPTTYPQPTPLFTWSHPNNGSVLSVAWSPDGRYLAFSSSDTNVWIWDAHTRGVNMLPSKQQGHTNRVTAVTWSPDGRFIASGSWDGTIKIWDLNKGYVKTYKCGSKAVNAIAWSPNGRYIVAGNSPRAGHTNNSLDPRVMIWDTTTNEMIYSIRGPDDNNLHDPNNVHAVAWSFDSQRFAWGADMNPVHVWDVRNGPKNGKEIYLYTGHQDTISSIAWAPQGFENGDYIASGSGEYDSERLGLTSDDTTVQVWNAVTGINWNLGPYTEHKEVVLTLAWSPDGKRIASGSADKTMRVWDPQTYATTLYQHTGYVFAVAWSPDSKRIASGSADAKGSANGILSIWQAPHS